MSELRAERGELDLHVGSYHAVVGRSETTKEEPLKACSLLSFFNGTLRRTRKFVDAPGILLLATCYEDGDGRRTYCRIYLFSAKRGLVS